MKFGEKYNSPNKIVTTLLFLLSSVREIYIEWWTYCIFESLITLNAFKHSDSRFIVCRYFIFELWGLREFKLFHISFISQCLSSCRFDIFKKWFMRFSSQTVFPTSVSVLENVEKILSSWIYLRAPFRLFLYIIYSNQNHYFKTKKLIDVVT